MSRHRKISIRHLMAGILLLGIALAFLRFALKHRGPADVEIFSISILLATNVLAWFQKARWQVFWVGFGIAAWAYIALALGAPAGAYLPTSVLLDGLHDRLYPEPPDWHTSNWEARFAQWPTLRDQFQAAGHSLVGLALGILGGVGAILLFPARARTGGEAFPPDGAFLRPGWILKKRAD